MEEILLQTEGNIFIRDKKSHRWTEGHIDEQKDIWMNRGTHRWTEGHMDGQKDTINFVIIKKFPCNFLNIFFDSSLSFYMQMI